MRITLSFIMAILSLMLSAPASGKIARVFAQTKSEYDADRKRAFQLVDENKFPEALPLLEKLAATRSDDAAVLERLSFALVAIAASSRKPPDEIKKDFIRARALAQKSKDLGNDSQLVQMILDRIPADGNAGTLAENTDRTPAQDALFEGESAFGRGEMERAIRLYERAAQLDPKLYEAPLFIGDAYFKLKKIDKASEAYARAIAIDPDRETAYRYWGDVLLSEGRMEESKEKFIDAIIAEPYNRSTWEFLQKWAQSNRKELGHPRIDIPTSSEQRNDDKNIDIPTGKQDGSDAWMVYSVGRAEWMSDKKFAEAFPNEREYRHSLREEAGALRLAAESVNNRIKEGKLKEGALDLSIANLLKVHKAGLIEAYVLLAIPDPGVARDYEAFRKSNRDKLRRYLNEFVISSN